ncbi:MAG: hypothetical protein JXR88_00555 [Clostridia bacterium]|nr:hypothetical protein [Clostridia bacterium]
MKKILIVFIVAFLLIPIGSFAENSETNIDEIDFNNEKKNESSISNDEMDQLISKYNLVPIAQNEARKLGLETHNDKNLKTKDEIENDIVMKKNQIKSSVYNYSEIDLSTLILEDISKKTREKKQNEIIMYAVPSYGVGYGNTTFSYTFRYTDLGFKTLLAAGYSYEWEQINGQYTYYNFKLTSTNSGSVLDLNPTNHARIDSGSIRSSARILSDKRVNQAYSFTYTSYGFYDGVWYVVAPNVPHSGDIDYVLNK